MNLSKIILVAVTVILSTSITLADDDRHVWNGPPPPLGELASFGEIDENMDQLISPDEMHAFMKKLMEQRMGDEDGRRQHMFDRVDTDGDGYLSPDEFDAMSDKMREHRDRWGPRDQIDRD